MKRILITDDSSIMRRNLNTILSGAGYEVVAEAANGEEALRAYHKYKPNLVTMDITMPIMDGLETVKRMVNEAPDAKIIVISAFDQRSMLFEAMENGAKQYLIKPITADKLLAMVELALTEAPEAVESNKQKSFEQHPKAGPYFTVENKDGKFIISIEDPGYEGPYTDLQTVIQGLLFVKPLDIAFHFRQADHCHPLLAQTLDALIGAIRQAGGQASVMSGQEKLAAILRKAISAPIEAQ